MATNFLDLATTLEYLGAKCLLKKKVNFVPWKMNPNPKRQNGKQWKLYIIKYNLKIVFHSYAAVSINCLQYL